MDKSSLLQLLETLKINEKLIERLLKGGKNDKTAKKVLEA